MKWWLILLEGVFSEHEFVDFLFAVGDFVNLVHDYVLESFLASESMFHETSEGLFADLGAPFVEEFFPRRQFPPLQVVLEGYRQMVETELFAFEGDDEVNVAEPCELEKCKVAYPRC